MIWNYMNIYIYIIIYIYYIYIYPRCSMYGMFTYIWAMIGVNVGKYSTHGASGYIYIYKYIYIIACSNLHKYLVAHSSMRVLQFQVPAPGWPVPGGSRSSSGSTGSPPDGSLDPGWKCWASNGKSGRGWKSWCWKWVLMGYPWFEPTCFFMENPSISLGFQKNHPFVGEILGYTLRVKVDHRRTKWASFHMLNNQRVHS